MTTAGAAGASLLFAIDTEPALGARAKNAVGFAVATLIGALLWWVGLPWAWTMPLAWYVAFLLLWASHFEVGPNDMIWLRAATAIGLVALLTQFFG
jgi:hypothetical protein